MQFRTYSCMLRLPLHSCQQPSLVLTCKPPAGAAFRADVGWHHHEAAPGDASSGGLLHCLLSNVALPCDGMGCYTTSGMMTHNLSPSFT